MPLSRVQTVVRGKGPTPRQRYSPCRGYPTESSKMSASQVMVFNMKMTCEGCANAARKVLSKLGDSVTKVDTDLQAQTVTVTTILSEDEILDALQKTGKEVTPVSKT